MGVEAVVRASEVSATQRRCFHNNAAKTPRDDVAHYQRFLNFTGFAPGRQVSYNLILMSKIVTLALSMVVLSASVANAGTITVTQTWNAKGYATYDFTLDQESLVDIQFVSGYSDPTFSLMNSAGLHLITADEEFEPFSRLPHLTQTLAT